MVKKELYKKNKKIKRERIDKYIYVYIIFIMMEGKTNFLKIQKEKEVEKVFILKQHLLTKFCTLSKYIRN